MPSTTTTTTETAAPVIKTFDAWVPHLANTLRLGALNKDTTAHSLAFDIFNLLKAHFGHLSNPPVNVVPVEDIVHSVWEPLVDCAAEHPETQNKLAEFIPCFLSELTNNGYEEAAAPQIVNLMWFMMDDARGGPCELDTPCDMAVEEHIYCFLAEPKPSDGTPAQKRAFWANYCRFCALLDKAGTVDLSKVLTQVSEGVLWGESGPRHNPDAGMLAFEQVFSVCGELLWERGGQWNPDGERENGPALTKRWKEYEWTVRKVMNDQGRDAEVRASAGRVLEMMKAVRLAKRKEEEE
ncbi:hypothetical protein DFP73DRAFT_582586 [Morchella snyderi]|nr:hypothetical protein DFP73DRAFT_582586 [Morchella snyderi]